MKQSSEDEDMKKNPPVPLKKSDGVVGRKDIWQIDDIDMPETIKSNVLSVCND